MFKYAQHDGYDKYHTEDYNGNTEHTGRAIYGDDGTLTRWDNYSPCSGDQDSHIHEWINRNSDGSYEYGAGKHSNH